MLHLSLISQGRSSILIFIPQYHKLIFSLGFNKRDDSWPEKDDAKRRTNFVICHPVSSSFVLSLLLLFGRRQFFGDSFLCVFPQRRLVNVANFRHAGKRASTLFFLPSASTLLSWTFENHSKGINDRAYDSNVKYFESVNRWKVYPFLFVSEGDGSVIFSPFFRESKVFAVLIANCLDPAALRRRELSWHSATSEIALSERQIRAIRGFSPNITKFPYFKRTDRLFDNWRQLSLYFIVQEY